MDKEIILKMIEMANDIKDADAHNIILFQLQKGLELIDLSKSSKKVDVSEQIQMISDLLGFDLKEIVTNIVQSMNKEEVPPELQTGASDDEVLSFLESQDEGELDKYREKLNELREL